MWVICPGDSVKGGVGACPQKDFTEVLLQRFEALFQDPSSVSLLFICYVLYTMSRKTWYDYTVADTGADHSRGITQYKTFRSEDLHQLYKT